MPRPPKIFIKRAAELYLITDKPLSKNVMCRLIEVLMGYYGLKKGYVIAQLESQIDKVNAEIDAKNNFNSNEKIKIKSNVSGNVMEVTNANFKADSPIIPKFDMPMPSKSSRDRYFKKSKGSNVTSLEKASNLKLVISESEVQSIETEELKKVESKDNIRKLVLYLDVEDKALPPWYMREHNKKAIIRLESILNKNPNQSDDYAKKMVERIKACSPEEEHVNISNSIEWYRKNINSFTQLSLKKTTGRPPFNADLITFDSDEEEGEGKVTATILIKFHDYLGYLPFYVDILDGFLEEPDDEYQIMVVKKDCEYNLRLEIKSSNPRNNVTYSVTLVIYDNMKPKYSEIMRDLIPKEMCDKEYALTKQIPIASSIIKFDSKNGYTEKQTKKVMNIFDEKFSLSYPGQWLVEASKCDEKNQIETNEILNDSDDIRAIKKSYAKRPELTLTQGMNVKVGNRYLVKLL